jgi:hypothetical protein
MSRRPIVRADQMASIISPVKRRPPVLPEDATSTTPVRYGDGAFTATGSPTVQEARCYDADKDIIEPRWLRVSATPWEAPYRATQGYGRPMHSTLVSHDSPDGFQIAGLHTHDPEDVRAAYEHQEQAPARLPQQLSPDRGGVSLAAPEFFQPTAHPPLTEKRFRKVLCDGRVLLEPHKVVTRPGFSLAPTPRHLLPSARGGG